MEPILQTLLVSGGIFICSFMIGYNWRRAQMEDVIESTIDHLIKDGYIATRRDKDGDIELIQIKDLNRVDF